MPKFAGFTPPQTLVLLQKMGYTGSDQQDEIDDFIASQPGVQAKLGKYAEMAQKRLETMGYEEGGVVTNGTTSNTVPATPPAAPDYAAELSNAQQQFAAAQMASAQDPKDKDAKKALENAQKALTAATSAYEATTVPTAAQTTNTALENPTSTVTPANVAQIAESNDQLIAAGTGQVQNQQTATASTVDQTQQATTPQKTDASKVDPTLVDDKAKEIIDQTQAATAEPTEKATVRGQLEMLMQDFEGGETPVWASGAMREAMSIMQKRGMGASSMAGQAVVQAAMESAVAVAGRDAQTFAAFEMQNLNNQQATTIFKTQQRIATLLSDQSQENAAKQFNAASENQVNQFFADLEATASRFNAEQINSINRFNAGEKNVIEQFNKSIEAQREQFNAQNDLVIAQANAQWRQNIATTNTAAQNEANMEFAKTANNLTQRALDQIWQKERDLMSFAFAASESLEERNLQLLLANKSIDASKDSAKREALGYTAGRLLFG